MAKNNNVFVEKFNRIRIGLASVFFVSFFINVLMLASPLYMLQIYDRVLTSRSTDTLLFLTLIVIAAIAVIGLLEALRGSLTSRIGGWLSQSLSGDALKVSIRRTLRQEQTAHIQSMRDLDTVAGFLTTPSIYPLFDAPWSVIYLAVLFLLHPLLGWIAVAGAVILLVLAVINDRSTRQLQSSANETRMAALQYAESSVRNADVVEAMGMSAPLVDKWNQSNNKVQSILAAAQGRSGILSSTSKFVRMGVQVAMLGTGALLVIGNELTAGAIVAASILVGRALAPVDQVIATWRSGLSAKAAHQRLRRHFEEQQIESDNMQLPKPRGEVACEGLNFAYSGSRELILRNVNFELGPGEILALIGPSGSGKTTLVRILLGNLIASSGHARLDGMDVAQWDPSDRGAYLGYLPQDVELFSGTVRENIARLTEGDSEKVIDAAKQADVHDLIMRLPSGYDTVIGDGGVQLSGGQRQRVALARALYGNPSFIVLDEPNASLDKEGDEALARTLAALKAKGITTIVISHRSGIFDSVDKIMLLKAGSIAAYGPKDEVLGKTPTESRPTKLPTKGLSPANGFRAS